MQAAVMASVRKPLGTGSNKCSPVALSGASGSLKAGGWQDVDGRGEWVGVSTYTHRIHIFIELCATMLTTCMTCAQ